MNGNTAARQVPAAVTAPPFTLTLDDPAIRQEIERIRSLKRTGLSANVDAAIAIGEALDRIKSQLKRGLWSRLLRDELHYGFGTAERNVRLARFAMANPLIVQQFKHLGASKLSYLAALDPAVREKVIAPSVHRLSGGGTRTLEQMNPNEFLTYIRGLDPSRHKKAPRLRHLMRVAIQAADRLASSLSALRNKNIESSPLYPQLEEAMLRVMKVLKS